MTMVIFCKEQLIHRESHQTRPILGWPVGALKVRAMTGSEVDDPSETGVWATVEDEVSHSSSSSYRMIDEESPGVLSAPGADGSLPDGNEPTAATYVALAENLPPPPPAPSIPTTVLQSQPQLRRPEPNPQHPS